MQSISVQSSPVCVRQQIQYAVVLCGLYFIGAGPDGVEEIKRHRFFASIDWNVSINNLGAKTLLVTQLQPSAVTLWRSAIVLHCDASV